MAIKNSVRYELNTLYHFQILNRSIEIKKAPSIVEKTDGA
jgi:hypothetical protein